jgi:hypothetical protein
MRRCAALFLCAAAACGSGAVFRAGVFTSERVRYRVGTLGPSWRPVKVSGGQVAFVESRTSATISANAVCGESDAPLRVLTGHLLIGLTERRILAEKLLPFDGREALRTEVWAKLDGVPVQLDLLVLKKDGCVFDLVYVAPPGSFATGRADFERFAQGFRKLPLDGDRP